MAMRQRTIPVTLKQEIEVQTDVKLLENYLTEEETQLAMIRSAQPVRLSDVFGESGVLRSFSEEYLLKEFGHSLQELKQGAKGDQSMKKRLQILEKQIQGLLKRSLLLNKAGEGNEEWTSYYLTLNEKEKQVINFERQQARTEQQLRRYANRISQLEEQVLRLQAALQQSQLACQQNQHYQQLFGHLVNIVREGKNKPRELQQAIEAKIIPALAGLEVNLQNIAHKVNRSLGPSVKSVVQQYSRELDRLLKDNQLSEQRLSESIGGLCTSLKMLKGGEHWWRQLDGAANFEEMNQKYHLLVSLFRSELDALRRQNPMLKGAMKLDQMLKTLELERTELVPCKGWIQVTSYDTKVQEVQSDDRQSKAIIHLLAVEFKKLLSSYPQIKTSVSGNLLQLFETGALEQLVDTDTVDRLRGIVVYRDDVIKVDNIYSYENSKDKEMIFHLRVLIKALLEEMDRIRNKHNLDLALDEGIMELLRKQAIDGLDVDAIIGLFRPLPKVVQVQKLIEVPVYNTVSFEKGVPIYSQKTLVATEHVTNVVQVGQQVPVYIDRPVDNMIHHYIPVHVETQKAIEVEVLRDVIVEKIVERQVPVQVLVEKKVELRETIEVPKVIEVDRIVEVPHIVNSEKLVETVKTELVEVEKIVEKPVYLYETRTVAKEVQVKVDRIFEKVEYVQVQRSVPYIINTREVVYLDREVPIVITNVIEKEVPMVEYRERLVPVKEIVEVIKEVEVLKEKEVIREVEKQVFFEKTHFIKGDIVETYKEIEVFVDRPLIKELLVTKDLEIERVVPMYIHQQVIVPTEINVPYVNEQYKELEIERIKVVPQVQQIIKEVRVEKPVPVIVEKEVVRVEKVYVDRIVQKIVEVPRVVQVQKIVQKIVVVPRIVQRIVQVPKIVQKIVIVEQPVLQIVQIQIPMVVIQQVEKIVEVVVEKEVIKYVNKVEIVQKEKLVEVLVERDRPVEINVQRRIPYEVVREIPVQVFRDRIQYQKVEIFEVRVETVEVPVPIKMQEIVQVFIEKPVVLEKVVERLVKEVQRVQVEKPLIQKIEVPKIVQITVQKAVMTEVAKQVPGQDIIKYVYEPKPVQLFRDRIVEMQTTVQVPKIIYLENDKIVHSVLDRLVEVPVNQVVVSNKYLEVNRPVSLMHYKEVAVQVPIHQEKLVHAVVEQIKEVEKTVQKTVEVEVYREKMLEVINQVKKYLREEIIRQIEVPVQIPSAPIYEYVNVPSDPVMYETKQVHNNVQLQDRIIEKVFEKVIMLPQVVEVVKNIHHISEVQALGVAANTDITQHTQQYVGVSQELKAQLTDLLASFKTNANRQPELRNLINIIERSLKAVDEWIRFPKLIEVPKEVQKVVEKERVVLVPTEDKGKEATLSYMVQKLVTELKRVRDLHRLQLNLDQDLLRIFFTDRTGEQGLDRRYSELTTQLKAKYASFGGWADSNPLMVNYFLQDHFSLRNIIDQANAQLQAKDRELDALRRQNQAHNNRYHQLHCLYRRVYEDYVRLIQLLRRSPLDSQNDQLRLLFNNYEVLRSGTAISKDKSTIASSGFDQSSLVVASSFTDSKQDQIGALIERLSKSEMKNADLLHLTRTYENEKAALMQQLKLRNDAVQRLQNEFNQKISRLTQQMSNNPNVNKNLLEENRALQEKLRMVERECDNDKRNIDKLRSENDRMSDKAKKDLEREIERREREIKDNVDRVKRENEREVAKIKGDFERIKREKDRLDVEMAEAKKKHIEEVNSLREGKNRSSLELKSLANEEISNLKKRIETLELQLQAQRARKAIASSSNVTSITTDKQYIRLKSQYEKLLVEKTRLEKQKLTGADTQRVDTQTLNKNIALERQIISLQQQLNSQTNQNQRNESELQTKIMNLERQNRQLQFKGQSQKGDSELIIKNSNLEREITILQQQMASQSQRADLESQSKTLALERQIRYLQNTLNSLQQTGTQSRQIDLQNKYNALQRQSRDTREAYERQKNNAVQDQVELKSLREKVKRLQVELETQKKELQVYLKTKGSVIPGSIRPNIDIMRPYGSAILEDPANVLHSGNFPQQIRHSREQYITSELRSSSSRKSAEFEYHYKSQMTMREFIEMPSSEEKDMFVTRLMIKLIDKIEQDLEQGSPVSYTPQNIYIQGFNPRAIDRVVLVFGAPITNRMHPHDGLYLAPEVLQGEVGTRKSVVFTLGVIFDQLLHGTLFFRSIEDIENLAYEFKVRNERLNPILKNTLFEIMCKDPQKRLELPEAKRRLSLQKYIAEESRMSYATSSRIQRSERSSNRDERSSHREERSQMGWQSPQ